MANISPDYGITIRVDGLTSSQPVAQITQAILAMGASITALDGKHAAVVATGSSDQLNQINNVFVFSGIFWGLPDGNIT